MNGLIKKDMLTIKKKASIFSVLMIFGGIVFLVYLQGVLGIMMLSVFILPLFGAFEHFELSVSDDKWKWDKYAVSLPLTKSDIIRGRFYVCGAVLLAMFFLSLALNIGAALILNQFSLPVHIIFAILGLPVGTLFMCISIPCGYKWGLQGASITAILTMLITGGGVLVLIASDFDIFDITAPQFALISACVILFSFIMVLVAHKVSTVVYEMKHK